MADNKINWSGIGTNMINTVGNGIVGGLIGLANSALQHKYNKELADNQFAQNVSMWNMQNEYNSPLSQRQRLEDAGLNPSLLYGNGGGSTGNASQMPEYQAFGQSIGTNMLQGAQIANLAAQARLTNAQADKQERENPYVERTLQAQIDNYLADVEVKKSTVRKMEREMKKIDVDILKVGEEIKLMTEQINLTIAQTKHEDDKRKLTEFQQGLVILQQALTTEEINTEKERTKTEQVHQATAKAQGDMYKAEAALALQKGKTEEHNTAVANATALYKEWEATYVRVTGRKPDANLTQSILTLIARGSNPELYKMRGNDSFPVDTTSKRTPPKTSIDGINLGGTK